MKTSQNTGWHKTLLSFVDAVFVAHGQTPDPLVRDRVCRSVVGSIMVMPSLQRAVVIRILAATRLLRVFGGRQQGVWLLTTRFPVAHEVGHALAGLVAFHAWCEVADDPQ
jgi:hypothetical protein